MTVSKFIQDKVIVRTNKYKYVLPLWDLLHPNRNHIKFSKMLFKEDANFGWSPGYDSGWYIPKEIRGAIN